MQTFKTFYRRNLPHFQPLGETFFVTFRLVNSLPRNVWCQLKKKYEDGLKVIMHLNPTKKYDEFKKLQRQYFQAFERYLDNCQYGPRWLEETTVAEIVRESLHYRNGKVFSLICYTIMPNHVHAVFKPNLNFLRSLSKYPVYPVTYILENLKKWSGREANKVLSRHGKFWQHESYDHDVRDAIELGRIVQDILNNPVTSGLVEKWADWPWSYVNYDAM